MRTNLFKAEEDCSRAMNQAVKEALRKTWITMVR